jgi:hypothetical protein
LNFFQKGNDFNFLIYLTADPVCKQEHEEYFECHDVCYSDCVGTICASMLPGEFKNYPLKFVYVFYKNNNRATSVPERMFL